MSTDNQNTESEPGPQSVTGPRIDKGLVIVNTGKGKGKTTAAMGVLVRAWGRGMKVIMFQFIPSKNRREFHTSVAPFSEVLTQMISHSPDISLAIWAP